MHLRQCHGILLGRSPMAGRHRVVLHRCVGGDGAALVGCFLYRDSPYAYPALSPCCRRPLPCHRRRCRHPRRRCRHPRRHHRRHHRCHRRHPPSVIAPSVIAASDDVGAIGAQPLPKKGGSFTQGTPLVRLCPGTTSAVHFRSALVRYRGAELRQSVRT